MFDPALHVEHDDGPTLAVAIEVDICAPVSGEVPDLVRVGLAVDE